MSLKEFPVAIVCLGVLEINLLSSLCLVLLGFLLFSVSLLVTQV